MLSEPFQGLNFTLLFADQEWWEECIDLYVVYDVAYEWYTSLWGITDSGTANSTENVFRLQIRVEKSGTNVVVLP